MFLIPLVKPFDWRRPPVVTMLIILANVLVFAIWQAPTKHSRDAFAYYFESGLAEVELPRYAGYLERVQGAQSALVRRAVSGDPKVLEEATYQLQSDEDFQRALHAGQIVTPNEPLYAQWRERRVRFDQMLAEDFDWQHSFIPTIARWDTWFSHMFLHGSWAHLIGNMIVLALVGVVVEEVLGGGLYLVCYVLSGLGSVAFYWLFHQHSPVPLLGASGAISGVSGMCAAIFGLRKINFFYFAFVYFDYVRAPAVLLLGLWLANEVFQQLTDTEGHVAYVAHIGGLITGAGLIGLLRLAKVGRIERFLAQETADDVDRREVDRAMALADELKFGEAVAVFEPLTARRPDDYELLVEAYKAARHVPDSPAYHRIAGRVLALYAGNRAVLDLVTETFREYLEIARPHAQLSVGRAAALAQTFAAADLLPESERLAHMLAKQNSLRPEVAAALVAVGEALLRAGQRDHARRWLEVVKAGVPGSPHADRANALLQRA